MTLTNRLRNRRPVLARRLVEPGQQEIVSSAVRFGERNSHGVSTTELSLSSGSGFLNPCRLSNLYISITEAFFTTMVFCQAYRRPHTPPRLLPTCTSPPPS